MSRFLRGETLVGQGRLKHTQSSDAQTCSALCALKLSCARLARIESRDSSHRVKQNGLLLLRSTGFAEGPGWELLHAGCCKYQHEEPALKGAKQMHRG